MHSIYKLMIYQSTHFSHTAATILTLLTRSPDAGLYTICNFHITWCMMQHCTLHTAWWTLHTKASPHSSLHSTLEPHYIFAIFSKVLSSRRSSTRYKGWKKYQRKFYLQTCFLCTQYINCSYSSTIVSKQLEIRSAWKKMNIYRPNGHYFPSYNTVKSRLLIVPSLH